MKKLIILLVAFFTFTNVGVAQSFSQLGGNINGPGNGEKSGSSVSMPDPTTIAVGSSGYSFPIVNDEAVRIYRLKSFGWERKGDSIVAVQINDRSGNSVCMPDSNIVAIGSYGSSFGGSDAGLVRIYRWNGSAWVQKGGIISGVTSDRLGWSISMPDSNTIAIGSIFHKSNPMDTELGKLDVYSWNGTNWVSKGSSILGQADYDQCGSSVSMPNSNTVAVSSPGSDSGKGRVRIFDWNGTAWVQKGGNIIGEAVNDNSGTSISMPDENTIAIGAPNNDVNGIGSGHVRIYSWNGSSWIQKGIDLDGEAVIDFFGTSVSMPNSNTIAIGIPEKSTMSLSGNGQTRIYIWNGSSWIQRGNSINGDDNNDKSGSSVNMPDENTIAIGFPNRYIGGLPDVGITKVFSICETTSLQTITACNNYLWSSTGLTYSASGVYYDTLTSTNGCDSIAILNLTITIPTTPVSGSTINTDVTCFGGTNGAIDLSPSGGTSPYTFNWGSGITTEDRSALAFGNYSVIITDAGFCKDTIDVTITQPTAITSSITSQTNVLCNGASTGDATVTASGGTGAYTYSWSPSGGTAATATGLSAGVYTCTITDSNSCSKTQNVTITQPASALFGSTVITNVSCNAGSTGAINLTTTGGTAPYTYNWGGGITTEDRTGLIAGSYSVTITDANSCTALASATITQPATALSGSVISTNIACFGGATGSINLTPSGGTAPYTFNWGGGITTKDRTGLIAGTYNVTITDANGCTALASATITQPASAVSSSSVSTNIACFGNATGSINLTPAGGTAPYTFNWGGGITTEDRTGLTAGLYSVTITDANSCTALASVTITQPTSALSGSTTNTNVSCNAGSNGAINLTATGGTAPYTYNWGGGITTEDRTGLIAGSYSVTITDANSCTALASATITQPATALSVSTVITNVNCNANSTGAINLSATGGTAPYTFDWGGGITTEDRTGLTAGTYNVTITDTNGCTVLNSATVSQPATALSASTVLTNVSCNAGSNGAINLTVTGGTAPYTFNWGGGITTEDRTGLTAGAYSVVITDANGCTNTQNVTITQPTAITSTISSQTNVLCFGANTGAATVFASGGTGAFTYSWSPSGGTATTASSLTAGTYIVTITDANACTKTQSATITQPSQLVVSVASNTNVLCNGAATGSITSSVTGGVPAYTYLWSTGATSANISGLSAGSYTCYATDANGCTTNVSSTITQPASITGTFIKTNVACFGGTTGAINLTATGGTAPYTYNWGGGITTEDRTGLAAGTYNVTITDANGCTATTSVTITQPGSALSGSTVITNVSCNAGTNGAINLTATGGTAPYTFNWGGGITTEDRTGLSAGAYSVTITDANGCTSTASATITQPAASVTGTTAITNVSCNAGANGAINLTTTGGTTPYTYNWGGGITTEDRTSLVAGSYNVTITDANSCTASVSAIVSQPTALNITSVQTNVSCNGGSNGSIDVTVSGGTSPYTYSWGSGITTQDRTGLSIGTYNDTITDANGCQSISNFTITQPSAITSSVVAQTNILCNGASTGSATVSASGGTGSYTYSWSPSGGTAATATGLTAGVYTCTITDANSCTKTETVTITQLTGIGFTSIVTNISCFGGNNGEIDLTANGGTAPYTYNWGGGITTEDRTALTAGPYSVTITDSNACASSFTINVTQPAILSSSIAITNASCFAGSDGELDITVSGGTAPYSYFWISSLTSEDLTSRSAGTYSVEIADAQGCTLNDTAIITQPTEIISTSIITNVDCSGNSTGAIDIVPSGGFGPYTYNWGGGITTEDRTGLTAGSYSIAITDATSCVSNISVTVSEPNVLTATNSTVNVACFGATTGSIDLTVSGGTAPYTYNWGGGLTSQDLTNLPSGSYTVSVTDDHGCTTTSNATLTEPTDISVVKDSLNILCFGDNSGMANVTVSGGVGPYTYTWNGTSVFTSTANFLTAGNYSVEITDNNGCMKTADFALTQNPAITSSFSISQCDPYTWESNFYPTSGTYQQIFSAVNGCDSTVTLNLNVFGYPTISISASESIICAGESVTLNATGGVSTATWDNGVINNQAFVPTSTTTYTATIANAQGCETIESIDVFVRDLPIVFMENFADSTCLDANMVACPFATPAGGIYSGSGVTGVLLNTQVAGLGQHEVIYTYSDQFGCTNSDTSTVNIVECDLPLNETGISENDTQLIQVWPNPTFGTVQIETTTDVSAVLTDCFGKIIQQLDLKAGQTQIDLSNESMGVYFIVIQDTTQQVIRLIKN